MSGESADAVARRHREKAARLLRSADNYEQGAAGERATAEALRALPAGEWMVFHDVRWPGRRYANIDHIAVGPAGVYVIDSKNWSGRVTLDHGVLRQNGYGRDKAVASVAEAAAEINGLIRSVTPVRVAPVLCFVRPDGPTGSVGGTLVCDTSNVVTMLASRAAVLTPEQVRLIILDLDIVLREAVAPPVAPVQVARARPRAAAKAPTRRSRKKAGLAAPLATLLLLAAFLGSPDVRDALTDGIADVIVDTDPSEPPIDREP